MACCWGEKQDFSAWAAHVSLNHTSSIALPHIHLSATLAVERRGLFGCKVNVRSHLQFDLMYQRLSLCLIHPLGTKVLGRQTQ